MSFFDDLLNEPLPSQSAYFEDADEDVKDNEEEKDDAESKDTDADSGRQNIVDKIEEALEKIEGIKIPKEEIEKFLSGDEDEIELEDIDDDDIDKVFDTITSVLDDEDVDVEKDDDDIKITLKESFDEYDIGMMFMEDVDEGDVPETDGSDIEEGFDCFGSECDDNNAIDNALDQLESDTYSPTPMSSMFNTNDDIDEEDPVLDEVEDQQADDMLAMAATPMLIKDELTAEEAVKFFESSDSDIAVSEGLIMESSIEDIYQEGVFANPNRPFKMTKKARLKQLYELSVQIEARAHRDPQIKQLDRAYAIERKIKANLRQKYHGAAKKRAMVYLKRLMKSKSGVLKNLGKKILPKR